MRDLVESIGEHEIVVISRDRSRRRLLRSIGGRRTLLLALFASTPLTSTFRVPFTSETDLCRLLGMFRDAGFAFVATPHGWPPAALFAHFREAGCIAGAFDEVTWRGPHQPVYRRNEPSAAKRVEASSENSHQLSNGASE